MLRPAAAHASRIHELGEMAAAVAGDPGGDADEVAPQRGGPGPADLRQATPE
jgi:hypothetical protein